MTRFKKLMALTLAATMVFSTNVFAAGTKTVSDTSVSGNGDIAYVDTNVFDVTLPTAKSLGFKLDPQGLVSLSSNSQATLSSLSAYGGRIVGDSTAALINNSPKKIAVTVSMAAVTNGASDVTLVTTSANKATVSNGSANNALVYVVPSKGTISAASAYQSAGKGIILTQSILSSNTINASNSDSFRFVLEAPEYSVSNNAGTYSLVQTGLGNGFGLQIGGILNPNADWLDFTGTSATKALNVAAVFSVTDVTVSDKVDTTLGIDNLVSSSSSEIMAASSSSSTPKISVKTITTASPNVTMTTGQGANIKDVVLTKSTGTTVTLTAGTHYTIAGDILKFTSATTTNVGGKVTVNFKDGDKYVLDIK